MTGFAAALFALYALIHIYVSHKQKAHFFYLMSLGAVSKFNLPTMLVLRSTLPTVQTIGLIISAVCVTDTETSFGYITVSPATYFVPMFMFMYVSLHSTDVCLLLMSFAQSLIIVSCYMVLSRFLWFAAPSQQRNSDNFLIPPNHITTIVSTCEIITLVVTITGSAIMIDGATDYSLYGNNDENVEDVISGSRVVLAGLVFQLCIRVYLMIVVWRVSFVSKNWIVKPTGLKYDTRTQLNVVNLSSMLLTVSAFNSVTLSDR